LTSLFKEFSGAFDDANALILLDIFKVRGRENVSQNVNSKTLAEAIKKRVSKFKIRNSKLKNIIYLPHSQQKNIKRVLKNILQVSSFKFQANVIMMGAGDIYHHTKRLLASSTRK